MKVGRHLQKQEKREQRRFLIVKGIKHTMHLMRPLMTHTHLLTSFTWGKRRRGEAVPVKVTVEAPAGDVDFREAAYVHELDAEWLDALEAADYSHLPKLKKITA